MTENTNIFSKGRDIELSMSSDERKKKGVFYTPYEIVRYMIKDVLKDADLLSNPDIKILDLSCGAGYFLTESLQYLVEKFDEKKDYIAQSVLWGADIDSNSVAMTKQAIYSLLGNQPALNIFCLDSIILTKLIYFTTIDLII